MDVFSRRELDKRGLTPHPKVRVRPPRLLEASTVGYQTGWSHATVTHASRIADDVGS